MRISAVILTALAVLHAATANAESIERLNPSLGIASIRISTHAWDSQIHVTFTEDMIPLGGGHDDFPVRLEGPGACNWGWRGPRTISCLFDKDERLPLAEQYALVIDDGLTTVTGIEVPAFRLEFETDKPVVQYTNIHWEGPTSPLIYVFTNVPVSVQEIQRRVRLQPLSKAVPHALVEVEQVTDTAQHMAKDTQFVLRPSSDLIADGAYEIRVTEGLAGIDSSLVGVAHKAGSFRTHAEFKYLGIGCGPRADRSDWQQKQPPVISSKPDCAPEQPVSLLFSAEPEIRGLFGILTEAGLTPKIARTLQINPIRFQRRNMTDYRSSKFVYGLQLSGFPAGTDNAVTLPSTVTDRFGRELESQVATFPTRNYVPAFLNRLSLNVIASGSGGEIEFATVNSDAIAARFYKDEAPGIVSLNIATKSPGLNEPGKAALNVEETLGKPWGVLIGEAAITQRALVNKSQLNRFPMQYATGVGAILSPWDVVVATTGHGQGQRYSIWVSAMSSGAAVSGATIELLERRSNANSVNANLAAAYNSDDVIGTARTDDQGFAEIHPTSDKSGYAHVSMARVTKGETKVVLPIQMYQFSHNASVYQQAFRGGAHPTFMTAGEGVVVTWGVTDKPLYRRGETVRIKGYARIRDDNQFLIPNKKEDWTLNCQAANNDLCAGQSINLDTFGAFETSIELSDSVRDGEYRVSLQSDTGSLPALRFRVASYKPKPHRVAAEITAELVVGDEPVPVRATTEYFAGGPLKNVAAQIVIETRAENASLPEPLLQQYYFGSDFRYWQQSVQTVVDAEFDDQGELIDSFELPADSPTSGTVSVTVGALHDGGEWAFSSPQEVKYVQSPYSLGLDQDNEVVTAGQAFAAGVVLIEHGDEQAGSFSVVQTLEYPSRHHNEKNQTAPDIGDECTVSISPASPASCELTPTRYGQAILRAQLMKDGENVLEVERYIHVGVNNVRPWYNRQSDQLDLTVTSEQLVAGETAEVVVDVPYESGSVLFALHRNNLLQQWREVLPKGQHAIQIPLDEYHAPGFTLTAIARRVGSEAGTSIGVTRVDVQSALPVPSISIETDRQEYKAGDEVLLSLTSSADEKTQLTVAVIDEGVLDLVANAEMLFEPQGEGFMGLLKHWGSFQWWQLSRAMDFFGSAETEIEEIVTTGSRITANSRTAAFSMSEVQADAEVGFAAKSGQESSPLRHNFSEAAYFNPTVMTSEDGTAEVSFTVPDNLGQWRVVVIGTDKEGQLFANTDKFSVVLPLEVRADLPARLIKGDSIQPVASVLNRKAEASEVTLSLALEAGEVTTSDSGTANLGSMESHSTSAAIETSAVNTLTLTATATDGVDNDGVRLTAPVVDTLESRSWTSLAPLNAAGHFEQPVQLPANVLTESAQLRVVLDKSVVGDLTQVFDYMNDSSHRSWEQILSRAVVAAFAGSWSESGSNQVTRDAMHNLLLQGSNFQTDSGGMSHFEPREDRANDYLSAYTLLAFDWIEQQGFEAPAYQDQLVRFMFERVSLGLRDSGPRSYAERKPSAYDMPVMLAALSSTPMWRQRLREPMSTYLRAQADNYDAAALAYALIAATNIDASSDLRSYLSKRLQAQLVETFDRTEITGSGYRFGNKSELHCAVLNALQRAKEFVPEHRALTKLVRGGYEFRDENSGFGNTHANAVCLVAMTRYRDEFEVPNEALQATVTAKGIEPFSVSLSAKETTKASDDVALALSDRRSNVTVTLTEGSAAYASTRVQYDVDLAREIKRSHGYTIKRTYSVYRRDKWRTLKKGRPIEQGEWVRIDLEVVTPVTRRFVAISDPTPAGLEPVDESLVSAIPGGTANSGYWWNAFSQRALSTETSKFYSEWLYAGSHTVTYYAQAKFAGDFMALPAKIESMYSDGVFATTEPVRLRVER